MEDMKKSKFIVLLLPVLSAARFPGCTTGGAHSQGCVESALR